MNHDANEPLADADSSETVLEGTGHVMLELSEVQPGANDTCSSIAAHENIALYNKDTVEPESLDIVGAADLGSKYSTGSDPLLDTSNVRSESSCDDVITESLSSHCDEIKDMEEEKTHGNTNKSDSDIKRVVADGNVIADKVTSKEYEQRIVQEKEEEEVCEVQNKEVEEGNKEKEEIEEINDKQKNKIDSVTDNKATEINNEEKETDILNQEKKINVNGNEPEAKSEGNGKHGLAAELLDSEDKGITGKEYEGEARLSTEKELHSRAVSEECEADVDDPDPYPEHINFVDVNAPTCYSPMVIDDDDDDDVVMIERRKGTSQYRRPGNKQKHATGNYNRDSSPEVVVQGESCRRRQEIVIDLDAEDHHDDDEIELETIKKKKQKKRPGTQKGVYCCNVECSSLGHDLRIAPVFILTHYGRKYKKGKAEKVCGACFEAAMQHQEVGTCFRVAYLTFRLHASSI